MISERTLRRWRREALQVIELDLPGHVLEGIAQENAVINFENSERILRLTQELMDLHLIRKG